MDRRWFRTLRLISAKSSALRLQYLLKIAQRLFRIRGTAAPHRPLFRSRLHLQSLSLRRNCKTMCKIRSEINAIMHLIQGRSTFGPVTLKCLAPWPDTAGRVACSCTPDHLPSREFAYLARLPSKIAPVKVVSVPLVAHALPCKPPGGLMHVRLRMPRRKSTNSPTGVRYKPDGPVE